MKTKFKNESIVNKAVDDICANHNSDISRWVIEKIKNSQLFIAGEVTQLPVPPISIYESMILPFPDTLFQFKYGGHLELCLCRDNQEGELFFLPICKNGEFYDLTDIVCVVNKHKHLDVEFHSISGRDLTGIKNIKSYTELCFQFYKAVGHILAIMQCNNVYVKKNVPPKKLQEKRARKMKVPFYSYHTLHINTNNGKTIKTGHRLRNRISPRVHLRRSHIREYSPGKYTAVTQCVVGDKSLGFVDKDYKVTV